MLSKLLSQHDHQNHYHQVKDVRVPASSDIINITIITNDITLLWTVTMTRWRTWGCPHSWWGRWRQRQRPPGRPGLRWPTTSWWRDVLSWQWLSWCICEILGRHEPRWPTSSWLRVVLSWQWMLTIYRGRWCGDVNITMMMILITSCDSQHRFLSCPLCWWWGFATTRGP